MSPLGIDIINAPYEDPPFINSTQLNHEQMPTKLETFTFFQNWSYKQNYDRFEPVPQGLEFQIDIVKIGQWNKTIFKTKTQQIHPKIL